MYHRRRQAVPLWVLIMAVLMPLFVAPAYSWTTPQATAAAPESGPPPAVTPTPPQEINLRQLGLKLYSHASFAFELANEDPQMRLRFGGKWAGSPFSWYVENLIAKASELAFTVIGDRQWVTLTSGEVLSCVGWEDAAPDSEEYQACDLGEQSFKVVHTASKSFFADVPARYTGEQVVVDGIPCYAYTVPDVDSDSGGEGRWYVAVETGLPVRFEVATIVWRFFDFDDPANAIPAPMSAMPAQLHVDDARMAFNGLSSFRYASQMMFKTTTVSTYTVAGVYVLAGPTWHAAVSACATCQPIEFLSSGGQFWQRSASTAPWVAVAKDSEDASFAELGNPFYAWPGETAPRIAGQELGQTRTVDDTKCQIYGLSWTRPANDGGEATADVQMCVTAHTMLPLATGYSARSATTGMDMLTVLSHLDDPINVVPLPPPQ